MTNYGFVRDSAILSLVVISDETDCSYSPGAKEIFTLHAERVRWREGEDFDAFLEQIDNASYEPNDVAIFTAHQLCSCRMGSDPESSVADGSGELHDTKGVWIGDASAFPTAPGAIAPRLTAPAANSTG